MQRPWHGNGPLNQDDFDRGEKNWTIYKSIYSMYVDFYHNALFKNRLANLDCKEEKNKLESISLFNIKFIELPHKLYFPSKKTIFLFFILKSVTIL